jgi:hypothetical protein
MPLSRRIPHDIFQLAENSAVTIVSLEMSVYPNTSAQKRIDPVDMPVNLPFLSSDFSEMCRQILGKVSSAKFHASHFYASQIITCGRI